MEVGVSGLVGMVGMVVGVGKGVGVESGMARSSLIRVSTVAGISAGGVGGVGAVWQARDNRQRTRDARMRRNGIEEPPRRIGCWQPATVTYMPNKRLRGGTEVPNVLSTLVSLSNGKLLSQGAVCVVRC